MRSPYGKKGGTSATAGKRSAVYRWTYPDGTPGDRRTFTTGADRAVAVCYRHADKWYVSAVFNELQLPAWARDARYTLIPCERVK